MNILAALLIALIAIGYSPLIKDWEILTTHEDVMMCFNTIKQMQDDPLIESIQKEAP